MEIFASCTSKTALM